METLLEVQNLVKFYGNKTSLTKAVNDISFQVNKGEFTAGYYKVKRECTDEVPQRAVGIYFSGF